MRSALVVGILLAAPLAARAAVINTLADNTTINLSSATYADWVTTNSSNHKAIATPVLAITASGNSGNGGGGGAGGNYTYDDGANSPTTATGNSYIYHYGNANAGYTITGTTDGTESLVLLLNQYIDNANNVTTLAVTAPDGTNPFQTYTTTGSERVSIDLGTTPGAFTVTFKTTTTDNYSNVGIRAAAITAPASTPAPEPASLALLGLGALGLLRRRR